MDYITEWGQYLERTGMDDVMRTQMGWTDKDHTSFVLGDKEYIRNGEIYVFIYIRNGGRLSSTFPQVYIFI